MKRCIVVFATPERQWSWSLELDSGATVGDALEAARRASDGVDVPWDADVGIFGELCDRATLPRDGDRIEIYRPLRSDPKVSRRARAAAGRAAADPASSRLPSQASKSR